MNKIDYKDFSRFHKYKESKLELRRMMIYKNNDKHHYVLMSEELLHYEIRCNKIVWYGLQ